MNSKESIPSTKRELIKNLLELSGKSASGIAKQAGLNRSNVTKWLKHGGSDVGEEAQDRILTILGVSGGTLRKDIVHVWKMRVKTSGLKPLVHILHWSGGKYEAVVPIASDQSLEAIQSIRGIDHWSLSELIYVIGGPIAIYDRHKPVRILLKLAVSCLSPLSDSPDFNPGLFASDTLKWRGVPKDTAFSFPVLRISDDLYSQWTLGSVSVNDYDRILFPKNNPDEMPQSDMTWDSFIMELKKRGIRPKDAFKRILEK